MDSDYQVFISFKNKDERGEHTPDRALAEKIYHHLKGLGLRVFFSGHTLRDDGASDYIKAIHQALDSALVLVAVGTSSENLASKWIVEECSIFLNELTSSRKEGGQLFTYVDGVPIDRLPIMLRGRQVITHGPGAMEELGQFVVNRLRKLGELDQDGTPAGIVPALRSVTTGCGVTKRRRWPWLAALLLVMALVGGLAFRFTAGGTSHPEFQLSETSAGDQFLPTVLALDAERVLALWTSDHETGDGPDIYGRLFDTGGRSLAGEFRVNTHRSGEQGVPGLARVGDGGFVAVWNSEGQDGDGWGVFGQLYDAEAKPVRSEFLVNSNWTRGGQRLPAVASNDSGGFVVVWDGEGEGDEGGVYGQLFDAHGERVREVFRANLDPAGKQRFAAVACIDDDRVVVAWEHEGGGGPEPFGIFARIFDPQGIPLGDSFAVNSHVEDRQRYPTLGRLPTGGFVALWTSEGQDGAGRGVYGQRFSAVGERLGEEFQVNTTVQGHQWLPKVAAGAGGFAAAWVSDRQDGAGASVVFQRFEPDGTRVGDEAVLNGFTEGDQIVRAMIGLGEDRYLVAWESAGQDGDGQGVFARVVDP